MSYKALRVIISGGGTGGHIFPAISIADALKKANPDTEILFVGANGKMEMEKVPSAGYRIVGLPVAGLQRKLTLRGIWRNLQLPFKLLASNARAGKVLKEFRPDIAVRQRSPAPQGAAIPHSDAAPGAERLRGDDQQTAGSQGGMHLRGL